MIEIERKFLVTSTEWGEPSDSSRIEQGYLFIGKDRSMRVRRIGEHYRLTLKVSQQGLARHEIETDIEPEKGQALLDDLCVEIPIQKIRHLVPFDGKVWEIDVFDGANAGLTVAEIELSSEQESFSLPPWVGPEVTEDSRFLNANLSSAPFSGWGQSYADLLVENRGR